MPTHFLTQTMPRILIGAGGVLLALLVLLAILSLYNRKSKQKGIAGERRVAKVLRRYARRHGGRVFNNAYLPLYDGACEVDHLLFGKFGIAVIETKNVGGTISGGGKTLTHQIGSKTHSLYNPQLQNKTHVDNVAHHLKKAGYGAVPLYSFVVFSNPDVRLETNVGIRLDALLPKLEALPDRRCDYPALYHALRQIRVKSPVKKLRHDWETGKK